MVRGRESKQKVGFPFPHKRGPWALDGPGGVHVTQRTDLPHQVGEGNGVAIFETSSGPSMETGNLRDGTRLVFSTSSAKILILPAGEDLIHRSGCRDPTELTSIQG